MMKKTLLALTCLISTSLCAQETNSSLTLAHSKKFNIGVVFSPDYCFRTIKDNEGSTITNSIVNNRESNEAPKTSYTMGLIATYIAGHKISISLGLQYSNKGYKTVLKDLVYGDIIDPRKGFIYPTVGSTPKQIQLTDQYHYLDIPVKLNYILGNGKLCFISTAGITANILLRTSTKLRYTYADGSKDTKTEKYDYGANRFNLSPEIGIGLCWNVSPGSSLSFVPTFRYGLLKTFNTPITEYLWSGGIVMGYSVSF
jgi:hypothetical protein